ncbi:polymer-forming cytoskeletal protein [Myxococcota bacterium]
MFGKSKNSNTTIIGHGARLVGTLELEGPVHIDGRCEGGVRSQSLLSVGLDGVVVGQLTGHVVVIAGRVEGTVVAHDALHVLKSGGLQGDAYYGKLKVDAGGLIDGSSHHGPPLAAGALPAPSERGTVQESGLVDTRSPLSVFPAVALGSES